MLYDVRVFVGCTFLLFFSFLLPFFDAMVFLLASDCSPWAVYVLIGKSWARCPEGKPVADVLWNVRNAAGGLRPAGRLDNPRC
jgi:hypothetical protein